jgi:uroporphyrinogen-III synthase
MFRGFTIACLETRRGAELTQMIERAGGQVYLAPSLREVPTEDGEAIQAWLRLLAEDAFAVAIFLTGVGCRMLLERAERAGLLDAVLAGLARGRVVARGPKPVVVLKQRGVRIDFVPPEPNTSDELLAELGTWDLAGKTIGLQLYGGTTPFLDRLRAGLTTLGARVREVAPYHWEGPADERPVRDLIAACLDGRVDALAIFSSSQIHNLFAIAEEYGLAEGLRAALNRPRVLVAAVGPVSAEAIAEHGVKVDLQPEHPKLGHLLQALGRALAARRPAPDFFGT